jgi:hypothetical protein
MLNQRINNSNIKKVLYISEFPENKSNFPEIIMNEVYYEASHLSNIKIIDTGLRDTNTEIFNFSLCDKYPQM